MVCEKHDGIVQSIADNKNDLIKINESIKSNWNVTEELKEDMKEVQKTHVLLSNIQLDMNNIKDQLKVQNDLVTIRINEQETRSQENTKEIIQALGVAMSSKKLDIKELLVTKMIDLIVYGSIFGYIYQSMK